MHTRCFWLAGAICFLGLFVGDALHGQTKKVGEVNTPPAKGERYKDSVKVGDVAPDVWEVAGHVSPNPGGVGPLTRAFLLTNVVERAEALDA